MTIGLAYLLIGSLYPNCYRCKQVRGCVKVKHKRMGENSSHNQIRDVSIDVLKGIGIILMVAGHSNAPFTRFIYQFHMPLFFIASGYLWKWYDRKIEKKQLVQYIFNKIKTLWIPYFLTNTIFVVFNNMFLKVGLYTNNDDFYLVAQGGHINLHQYLSISEILMQILKNALFLGGTELGSATWFFRILFWVSIIYMICIFLNQKLRYIRTDICVVTISTVSLIIATYISNKSVSVPFGLTPLFCSLFVYGLGIIIRHLQLSDTIKRYRYPCIIISFLILVLCNRFGTVDMSIGRIKNALYFSITSVSGWILVYAVSNSIPNAIKVFLSYIGKRGIWIVCLNFISLKLVTWIYLLISDENMLLLAQYPSLSMPKWIWIPYVITGVLLPVIMEYIWMVCKKTYKKCAGGV